MSRVPEDGRERARRAMAQANHVPHTIHKMLYACEEWLWKYPNGSPETERYTVECMRDEYQAWLNANTHAGVWPERPTFKPSIQKARP